MIKRIYQMNNLIMLNNIIISGIIKYKTNLNGVEYNISVEYKDGEAYIFKANNKLINGLWILDLPYNDYFNGVFSKGKFMDGNCSISNGKLKTKTSGQFSNRRLLNGTIVFMKLNLKVCAVSYRNNKTILKIENSKCGSGTTSINNILFSCVLEGPKHENNLLSFNFYKQREKRILSYLMIKGNINFYKINNYHGNNDFESSKIARIDKDNSRLVIWTDQKYESTIKDNFLFFNCPLMKFIKPDKKILFVNENSKKIYSTLAHPVKTTNKSSSKPVKTTNKSSSQYSKNVEHAKLVLNGKPVTTTNKPIISTNNGIIRLIEADKKTSNKRKANNEIDNSSKKKK